MTREYTCLQQRKNFYGWVMDNNDVDYFKHKLNKVDYENRTRLSPKYISSILKDDNTRKIHSKNIKEFNRYKKRSEFYTWLVYFNSDSDLVQDILNDNVITLNLSPNEKLTFYNENACDVACEEYEKFSKIFKNNN